MEAWREDSLNNETFFVFDNYGIWTIITIFFSGQYFVGDGREAVFCLFPFSFICFLVRMSREIRERQFLALKVNDV